MNVPEQNPELEDFDPQVQRLIRQMQNDMAEIWQGHRGMVRKKKIADFNVKIANVIEWRALKYKLQLESCTELIEKLRSNIDKVMEQKWQVRDERDEARKQRDQLQCKIRELETQVEGLTEELDSKLE